MNRLILSMVFLFPLSIIFADSAFSECSQEQAIQKMRALSQARVEKSQAFPKEQQKYAIMAGETAGVGQLLASQNYSEACERYEAIARKYQVDLAAYEKSLAPLNSASQPVQQGGCDVVAASKKVNGIYQLLTQKLAGQNLTDQEKHRVTADISAEIDKVNPLIQTRPQEACAAADKIIANFELG